MRVRPRRLWLFFRGRLFLLGNLLSMIRNLVPILLLGLLAAAVASVLIGKEQIEQWMGGGVWAYAVAVTAGIPAYVCEGAKSPSRRHSSRWAWELVPPLPSCKPP